MTSKELITQLYVGYFDRAPDPEGLEFWIEVLEGGFPLDAIAQDFATQPEAVSTYPFLDDDTDVEAFIAAIYDNLFDRAPDAAGLAFWKGVLEGGFPPGSFILAIIEGASPADEAILQNKVDVACAWVELAADTDGFVLTEAYIGASRDALGDVSGDPETVTAAKAAADLFFQDGPSLALTPVLTTLAEDADVTARIKVADIAITDDGIGTNVLSLSGTHADLFELDGTELYLKAGTALDFETLAALDVTVAVDDALFGGSPDDTASLTLTITDANDAPNVALSGMVTDLSEDTDTSEAIKVANIVITDDALGTNVLSLSGDDADLFEIVGDELFLKAGTVLDADSNGTLDVSVEVDDADVGETPDDLATLSITLGDVNDAPSVALIDQVAILAEDLDTSARVKVAGIVVTDDVAGTNVLSLTGDDADLFEIDGDALYLKAGVVLDFETNATLDVTVVVDDADVGESPDGTAALSITVTDVNELPSVALANVVTTLAEDADTIAAIKVADIVLSDDGTGSNTLGLTGADAGLFEIVGTELYLKAGSALDFETNPVLDVSVTVDDATIGGDPDDSAALAIDITDVNEAPSVALANARLVLAETEETSERIKIADIVLSDDGLGTNVLSLTGADADLFEIDGDELYLKAGADLDFEGNPALDVTVEIEDDSVGSSPDDSASLSITVTDDNEAPTLAVINVPASLPEDTDVTTRVKVGDIVVTDDIAGINTLSLAGADAALFEIIGSELFLKAGTVLDFETDAALDVTVLVDDTQLGSGPEDSVALTIGVTDVNEAPSVALTGAVTELSEDTDTSARIKMADIVITDDAIGTNVLSLTGADADLFEIDGDELYLKAGTVLDFETQAALDVSVAVDDAGIGAGAEDSAALPVTILNVNEAPTVALIGATASIFEGTNTSAALQVATIQITDDGTGTNVLGLTGADAALFEIVGTSLRLKAGTALDAVANPDLDVTVTVDDATIGGDPDDSAALSIAVNPGAPGLAADNTEALNFVGNASSIVRAGQIEVPDADPNTPGNQPGFVINTDPNGKPYAGVASTDLSLIDVTGHAGLVSLGVIAKVDSEDFTLDNSGSDGDVVACLGEGNVFGALTTPSLSATGTWVFDNSGATGDMSIEIKAIDVAAGGTLDFNNVDICITGTTVNFSTLEAADLILTGGTTIKVAEDACLIISVAQAVVLDGMGFTITGSGTLKVVGNADDTPDFGSVLGTMNVDLSGIVLTNADGASPLAGDERFNVSTPGATDDDGNVNAGQHIIGTPFNDTITITDDGDNRITAGADGGSIGDPEDITDDVDGDILIFDGSGENTHDVNAGFDRTEYPGGSTDLATGEIVQITSGATFYGTTSNAGFTATADTANNGGTGVIQTDGTVSSTIDMLLATGGTGWTLLGSDDATAGVQDTLIGSQYADMLVDGAADGPSNAGEQDVLTGNGAADMFLFNFALSEEVQYTETQPRIGRDFEELNFDGGYAGASQIVIELTIGGNQSLNVFVDNGVDGDIQTSAATVAQAVAVALNQFPTQLTNVSVSGDSVFFSGASQFSVDVDSVSVDAGGNELGGGGTVNSGADNYERIDNGGAAPAFDGHFNDPTDLNDDDRAEVVLTFDSGTVPSDGDSFEITIVEGSGQTTTTFTYNAAGGAGTETVQEFVDLLADFINGGDFPGLGAYAHTSGVLSGGTFPGAPNGSATGVSADLTVVLYSQDANEGGIRDISFDFTPSVTAASMSDLLDTTPAGTLADVNVDFVTDFMVAADTLGFGLENGTGTSTNYAEAAFAANFLAAWGLANAAFLGNNDLKYFATGSTDAGDNGTAVGLSGPVALVFVNANGDDFADGVVAVGGDIASDLSNFGFMQIA